MIKLKRILIVACAVIIAFSITACGKKEKTYTSDSGIKITMDDGLESSSVDGFACFYSNDDCFAGAIKETFDDFAVYGVDANAYTLEEYESLMIQANGLTGSFSTDAKGNPYITYESTVDNIDAYCYMTVRKGKDAFWAIVFGCEQKDKDTFASKFEKWSASIEIN